MTDRTTIARHNIYDQDDAFWEAYRQGRPNIPESFFQRIYDYHSHEGGAFNLVHDAGAGGGVLSARFATRFNHVLVSDPSADNLNVARQSLAGDQYEFRLGKLEDFSGLTTQSVDMVFCGTSLHWCDLDQAFESITHQLKPGGTFAACLTGVAGLHDQTANKAWRGVIRQGHAEVLRRPPHGSDTYHKLKSTGLLVASAYDAVPLPEKYFERGARRLKLNYPPWYSWWDQLVALDVRDEWPYVNAFGLHDVVSSEEDSGWGFETEIKGLRTIAEALSLDLSSPGLVKAWAELQEVVGDRTVHGVWPCTLLLATKASNSAVHENGELQTTV
ncbi:hypothetical protein LTR62_004346 [Meristemomyces frigidus]|uniref:Methyltransferase type 11 domain-containing protein n=1 Tax=Meristemomyces frigidus TaxID=1508187 RepID=A0AAN7YPA1_9PEZI|nr:hypothetical protein LTR62_004346 [Meristemomyces frigidus]